MVRRRYLCRAVAVGFVLALANGAQAALFAARATQLRPPVPAPDIVVFITDDEPALDGRLLDRMPNARALFREQGITFNDFHSEAPLCCPARANLLSGQHAHNHGVTLNDAGMFDPRESIATELKALGYYTILVGKYMNRYKKCKGSNCYPRVPPGWDEFVSIEGYGPPENHSVDRIAQLADEFIREAPPGRPIFAWLAPFAPHVPYTPAERHRDAPCDVPRWAPPNFNEADVSDKPRYVRDTPPLKGDSLALTARCRSLLAVDDLVGTVRDALLGTGRLDDALLIYTGDNGMVEGAHRLKGKQSPYVTEVPFYLSWARLGSEPRTISKRLQNIDLAPTICELAGCVMGPYPNGQEFADGVNFAGLLDGSRSTLGRDAVLDEMPEVSPNGGSPPPPWYAVTTTDESELGRWHYIEYRTGERELYDVANGPCWLWRIGQPHDPCRLRNAVDDPQHAGLVAALDRRLDELKRERGGTSG